MRIIPNITTIVITFVVCIFISCNKDTKVPAVSTVEDTPAQTSNITQQANTAATASTTNTTKETIAAAPGPCCKTENVIIIVVDGARYSETWGDYTRQNIPNRFNLYFNGVVLGNFHNNGVTLTDSGHDAICTGNYENIENYGNELPQYPSIFQSWLKSSGKPAEKAWVIASKDKLQILGNCKQEGWANKYMPRTDCGNDGLFSGYRSDDTTLAHAKAVLTKYHPNLMLINFKDPDYFGHSNQWQAYINAIKSTDDYIKEVYDHVQNDETYRDKTTIIVTNDHGRHLNNVANGFIDHGDGCEGCRHIEFLGIGPDFKKGIGFDNAYEQIDISKTVAKLLHFDMEYSKGKVIADIFN